MKKNKSALSLAYIIAFISIAIILLIVSKNLGTPARLLTDTDDPRETVTSFFDALHKGDYEAADGFLGNCSLVNTSLQQEGDVTSMLIDALSDSISFQFVGDCRKDGLEASQTVRVTYFDIGSSAKHLNELTKQQIDTLLDNTPDASVLYDEETGNYRQEVVMEIFDQAAVLMLENATDFYVTKQFDISLFYEDSSWFISPSEELFACMLGGMN